MGCNIQAIGDGTCEPACDVPACDHDGRDCDPCLREAPHILPHHNRHFEENKVGVLGGPLVLEHGEDGGECVGYQNGEKNDRVEFALVPPFPPSFEVGRTTGQLSVKQDLPLDFEESGLHELTVRVTGCSSAEKQGECAGSHADVTVHVEVDDVADAQLTAPPKREDGGDVSHLNTLGGDVVIFEGRNLGVKYEDRGMNSEVAAWCVCW